ncbi:MAG: hypothetical protein WA614_06325 [Acidimicrobiales bacterium]
MSVKGAHAQGPSFGLLRDLQELSLHLWDLFGRANNSHADNGLFNECIDWEYREDRFSDSPCTVTRQVDKSSSERGGRKASINNR